MTIRRFTLTAAISLLGVAGPAWAGDQAAPVADVTAPDLWSDPVFQKQFLGTYGIHPELEPRLSPTERDLLQRVLPLMSANPSEAIRVLQAGMKRDSSASLDFTIGNLHFQQGQIEEAANSFRTAPSAAPAWS